MALGNLAQRFLVAVVAVPILLVILQHHRPEPTWAFVFVASLLAMRESLNKRLAEAGFKVVCLEQGEWHAKEDYPGTRLDWELQQRKTWATSPISAWWRIFLSWSTVAIPELSCPRCCIA